MKRHKKERLDTLWVWFNVEVFTLLCSFHGQSPDAFEGDTATTITPKITEATTTAPNYNHL